MPNVLPSCVQSFNFFLPLAATLGKRTEKRCLMKKYWLLTLVLSFFAGNVSAFDLPNYEDDAEFKQCTRVSNNWDPCVQEETTRALNKVKQQYRDILHMPQLLEWNGDVVKNTETMRDMYESWIAYRNRLCSLSHSAARYMDPILTEKYSCTLYHTLHHKDHLGKIIKLLQTAQTANRPTNAQNRQPLSINLFRITEHDDAFSKCMEDNKNTKTCYQFVFQNTQNNSTQSKYLYINSNFIAYGPTNSMEKWELNYGIYDVDNISISYIGGKSSSNAPSVLAIHIPVIGVDASAKNKFDIELTALSSVGQFGYKICNGNSCTEQEN